MLRALSLLLVLLLLTVPPPVISAEDGGLGDWSEKEIVVEMPLRLNVVFLGGGFAADESYLEEKLGEILPWYAPYIAYEGEYLGLNITEIDLNVMEAPRGMVEEYVRFVYENEGAFWEPEIALRRIERLEDMLNQYFMERLGVGLDLPVYWIDAWMMAKWLDEKGAEYLGIGPDEYTIYFILSALEIDGIVEYFVDTYSPETGTYFFTGGMSAYGGLDRLYFIDLTSVPLGRDRCDGEEGCKSPTPYYYPTLWEVDEMSEDDFYRLLATYISETIIYVFFRGYLWRPTYEANLYEYLLIIDATSGDRALEILEDFSVDYFDEAMNSLIPYSYSIRELDVIDVDDYPELREALFSTLTYEDDYAVIDCETVPSVVFNLPIIRRFENLKTVVTALFVLDSEVFVCRKNVVGRAFREGALAAISGYTLEYEGPTLTLYHEAAHVLGLRHPHDADPIPWAEDLVNWFYDWSATPMSYDPACTLRTMYEGIYFPRIDLDSMDIGVTIYLIKRTRQVIREALESLQNSGIEASSLPQEVRKVIDDVKLDLDMAAGEFVKYNYFNWAEFYGLGVQKASAFDYAFSAYQNSVFFSRMVEKVLATMIELRDLRVKLDEAARELEKLREMNQELEKELEGLRKTYEELLEKHSRLEEANKELKSKLDDLSSRLEEVKSDYQRVLEEKSALESEVDRLREELGRLSSTQSTMNLLIIVLAAALVVLSVLYVRASRRARVLPPPPPPPS